MNDDDARDIGLIRQSHQIEHQLGMLFVIVGNADRARRDTRPALELALLLLGELDAALDLANVVEIFGHLVAVARAKLALQMIHFGGHRIENAALALQPHHRARWPCRHRRTGGRTRCAD